MATTQNYSFYLGETWEFLVQCVDPLTAGALNLVNGYVEVRVGTSSALLTDVTLSASDPIFASGLVTFLLGTAQQESPTVGNYSYEIRSITPDGRIITQQVGTLTLQQSLFNEFTWTPPGTLGGTLDFSDPTQSALIGH